jgi:mono/diheme cytochrome c family protein
MTTRTLFERFMGSHRVETIAWSANVLAIALTLALAGCPKRSANGDDATARARDMFESTCATCHGSAGRGDGPAARALSVRPRDYTDPAWQRTITDAQIRDVIIKGGAGVGKSSLMPANPALLDDPAVVDALIVIIRAFGAKS